MKKLTALLCASVLVLSGLCAHAAEDEFDVSGSKKADPTELACPERQTSIVHRRTICLIVRIVRQ